MPYKTNSNRERSNEGIRIDVFLLYNGRGKSLKEVSGHKKCNCLVHVIVLVEADTSKMNSDHLAEALEMLGYIVSSTEVQ